MHASFTYLIQKALKQKATITTTKNKNHIKFQLLFYYYYI